jgi:predicted porin
MKKLLLATLVSALSITAAHAAPKVYGKINLGVDYVDQDGKDKVTQLNSNASRIGFKGEDELTPTLSAIYQLEYEADVDGDGTVFKQRNAYLGVKSTEFGTIKAGIFDSPIKEAQNKVDMFNDLVSGDIDMKKTFAGEERLSNSIAYSSPELEGVPVEFTLQVAMPEDDTKDNDSKNQVIGSAAFDQNGIYAALAYGMDTTGVYNAVGGTKMPSDILRLVGQVDLGKMGAGLPVTLGALYQNAQPSDDDKTKFVDKEDAFLISAMVKLPMEGWKAGLQYQTATTSFTTTADDVKINQFGGLVGYEFSKKTQAFGYLTNRKNDATDTDYKVFGLGMEHKF